MQEVMKRTLDTIRINIKLKELWLEQRIAESIAENLRRDFAYDVLSYVNMTYEVMQEAGINRKWATSIVHPAIHQAYALNEERIRTGLYTYHNGSGAHPRIVIGDVCEELVKSSQLLMVASVITVEQAEERLVM